MKTILKALFLVLAVVSAPWAQAQDSTPVSGTASNSGQVKGFDPRVKEINNRLMEQGARIKEGVKSGKITKDQAKPLWEQVKAIRTQEKGFFTANGKRELTDDQLNQLNQALNDNSKAIFAAKHGGAAPASSATPTDASQGDSDSDASN